MVARLEVQGGVLRLTGSVTNPLMTKALREYDIEPVTGAPRALFRTIGPFASNIAMTVRKASELGANGIPLSVGCFTTDQAADPQINKYKSEISLIFDTALAGAKNLHVSPTALAARDCGAWPWTEVGPGSSGGYAISGSISRDREWVLVTLVFRFGIHRTTLILPDLRLNSSAAFDYRAVMKHAKLVTTYLDNVLDLFDRNRLEEFAALDSDQLIALAKADLGKSETGDYAAMFLRAATLKAPDNAEALFLFGKVNFNNGDDEAAIENLEAAIRTGWSEADSAPLLKELYIRTRADTKARHVCEKFMSKSPTGARDRCFGDVAFSQNKLEDAEAAYATALAEAPEDPLNSYSMGLLKERTKQPDIALTYYYVALGHNFAPAKYQIGQIKLETAATAYGKTEFGVAIEEITDAITVSPHWRMYSFRALAYEMQADTSLQPNGSADYLQAMADYKTAAQLAGNLDEILDLDPWLIPNWAELLVVNGQFEEARRLITTLTPKLNSETKIRFGADWKSIKFIDGYIELVAASLMGEDTKVMEAILRKSIADLNLKSLNWSFSLMRRFLKERAADPLLFQFIYDFEQAKSRS